ncbi:hypothetical protein H0H92_011102 [Tricholoma furcatifolium]|nr:hypothetical protein H0H92_011102 [Tricholoma furcatifolium]
MNIWKMLNDPETYDKPEVFNPDRYITTPGKPAEVDPRTICFGFARRICPGQHLADASVFISCAMTLAVYNITKATENGVIITPAHGNTDGTISHPKPFKVSITPRSQKAVALIQTEATTLWNDRHAAVKTVNGGGPWDINSTELGIHQFHSDRLGPE